MEVQIWGQKSPVQVEVVGIDDSVLVGNLFLAASERVIDGINDERRFLPFQTSDGEFQMINKSTVASINPLEDGVPVKVVTRMDQAPVELRTLNGKVICGSVFLTNQDRVSDVFNSKRQFVPLETDEGELRIVNKSVIMRVKPLPQENAGQKRSDNYHYA